MAPASTKLGERRCAIDPDIEMRCSVQSGHKVWQGVSRDNASIARTTCPDDSMPWRSQLVCDHVPGTSTREPRCFTTPLAGYNLEGAVCVTAGEESGMHPTDRGLMELRAARPVSYDRAADHKDIEAKFTACYVQPFAEMGRDAVMVAYVPKGASEACRFLREDAMDACRHAGQTTTECARRVRHVYKDERDKPYACTLDTRHLPVAHDHDRSEWWRWLRHNRYDCRGRGWSCEDAAMREYEGGHACAQDGQCASAFEAGACDLERGVCATGTAKGTRCSTHEQCDHVGFVAGRCDASKGRCETGKTGTGASYYAPKECSPVPHQRHTFCGKMQTADGERFSGVCMPYDYDGKTFYGCKPFADRKEIERIAADEEDHQAQTRTANFSSVRPDWERLALCPAEDTVRVGDRSACLHTTHTVHLEGRTIMAANDDEATKRCAASRCDDACTPGMCHRDGGHAACVPSGDHAIATRADQVQAPSPQTKD